MKTKKFILAKDWKKGKKVIKKGTKFSEKDFTNDKLSELKKKGLLEEGKIERAIDSTDIKKIQKAFN